MAEEPAVAALLQTHPSDANWHRGGALGNSRFQDPSATVYGWHFTRTPTNRISWRNQTPSLFPEDALEEIRQERLLSLGIQDTTYPPVQSRDCSRGEGRVWYLVFPRGSNRSLPLACNAPFIQDPPPSENQRTRKRLPRIAGCSSERVNSPRQCCSSGSSPRQAV